MEFPKIENWEQEQLILRKESHKTRERNFTTPKQSYEIGIDEVQKVWRLNSQSGTQELPKIGPNVLIED